MEDSQWIAEGLTWWAGIFVVLSVAFGYRYWRWRRWLGRREDRQQILETIENADENTAAIWDPRYQSYVPVENIHEYRGGYAEKAKVNWDHLIHTLRSHVINSRNHRILEKTLKESATLHRKG